MSAKPTYEELERRVAELETAEAEWKKTEAALRKSEDDLARALAVAKVGSWTLDRRTGALHWSAETYRIFGVQPGTPMTFSAFLELAHPEDRPQVEEKWDAAQKGASYDIEHRIVVGRETRWVKEKADLFFDEAGNFVEGLGTVRDITKKKLAERELQENRNKYRTLFEEANDAIFVASAEDGVLLDANEMAERLTGRPRDEIIGMHQTELHPSAQEKLARTKFTEEALNQKGKTYSYFDVQHKNGAIIPVEISQSSIEVNGKPCVLGIFRDLSEKKKRMEKLRQYEAVIKAVTDPAFFVDRDYIYRIANEAYSRYFGKPKEAIIGHPAWEVMGEEQFATLVRPRLDRCFQGESVCYEDWFSLPDGTRTYQEVCYYPVFDTDGRQVVGAAAFARDHTAQKKVEQALAESGKRFRRVVETAQEGMWLVDRDCKTEFVNPRMAEMLGFRTEEMMGRRLFSFMDEQEKRRAEELMARREQGVNEKRDFKFQRRDGTDLWAIVSTNRMKTEEGKFLHALVMVTDITDRKRAEKSLQKSLVEKEVLLREIHHRVKNNMQTIVGLLRMHARRTDSANFRNIFNDCRDRIKAMSLIHESLYRTKNLAQIDFGDYLKKLCRNLSRAHDAGGKGITVAVDRSNVSLNIDQGVAVGLVVSELIANAFKHAFPNKKSGSVAVSFHDAEDGVELTVSDDGAGLPADFDIKNTSSLGLRLVEATVTRELGGTIDVESGNGARFIIRFKCESQN